MRELWEDTFFENKNEDAHEHVERVLDIFSLFNIPGVSQDAVMLRVFSFTLTGAAKRWVDRLTLGAINTWELLKKAFTQRYCPPSKSTKQLEDIHNFKQEGNASLYQSWECSSNTDGLAAILSKLDDLGRDIKKLKENVHGAQDEDVEQTKVLPCQLPPKEPNPRIFTLPCVIGNLNFYAIADLGIGDDRVIFDIEKKDHNFTIPTARILMEQQIKKKIWLDENVPIKHFCKLVKQEYSGTFRELRWWYCDYGNERKNVKGGVLSFPDFLLVRYGNCQKEDLIWDQRYAKWCSENSLYGPSSSNAIPLDKKPRPRDYTFKDWMLIKVGHTDVNDSVKKALLKSWIIDCCEGELVPDKNPRERIFVDYKWVFNLEIDQLANEYELGIGKKGHILEELWENYKKFQGKDEGQWYDYWLEEDEKQEIGEEEYNPPKVHLETFEVTRYSFDTGNSFICVTK
ncbi:BYPASS-related protein [Tanacetum coccineum]